MSLTLMPAVDVAAGRAAQSPPGEPDDPQAVAASWVSGGATWLHLVDLDRAHRRGENASLLRTMVSASRVPVQLSGGLDDAEALRMALDTGAARVNLASTATQDLRLVQTLVQAHGSRVVMGLDVRGEQVVARGSGVCLGTLEEVLGRVADTGVHEFLIADAERDGSRRGVNVDLFTRTMASIRERVPSARMVLSGGVSGLADLRALLPLEAHGAWAVVLGSALHHGRFTLAAARGVVEGDV